MYIYVYRTLYGTLTVLMAGSHRGDGTKGAETKGAETLRGDGPP